MNPANLDAEAAYARMLVLNGPSEKGRIMAFDAMTAVGAAPYWYHAAPAVDALRDGRDLQAITEASQLATGDGELGAVIATVAAARQNAPTVLNRYLAQLLEVTRFRRFGILPVVRQRIGDENLVALIATELRAAGVTDSQLNGSF